MFQSNFWCVFVIWPNCVAQTAAAEKESCRNALFPFIMNPFLFYIFPDFSNRRGSKILSMDYVRQNEIQGRNMFFFKANAYGISFYLT
jgi:hypothetical protein